MTIYDWRTKDLTEKWSMTGKLGKASHEGYVKCQHMYVFMLYVYVVMSG